MASVAERPDACALPAAAAVIASAALLFLGTGLHPVWWVTWFAPLPVLLSHREFRRAPPQVVASLAQLLGMSGFAHYALTVLGVPVPWWPASASWPPLCPRPWRCCSGPCSNAAARCSRCSAAGRRGQPRSTSWPCSP